MDKKKQAEYSRRYMRERYQKNRAAGLCGPCGNPTEPGHSFCPSCEQKRKAYISTPGIREKRASYMRDFHAKRKADGVCVRCNTEFPRWGRIYCKECAAKESAKTVALIQGKKRRAVEMFGNKCHDCGLSFECIAIYEFDHLDGSTKDRDLKYMFGSAGWPRIKAELAKCEMVCANCHRVRTVRRYKE